MQGIKHTQVAVLMIKITNHENCFFAIEYLCIHVMFVTFYHRTPAHTQHLQYNIILGLIKQSQRSVTELKLPIKCVLYSVIVSNNLLYTNT